MFSRNSQARLRTSLYKPIFKLEPLPSRASSSSRSISLQLQYSRKPNSKLVLFVYHSREKWPLLLDEFCACQPGTFFVLIDYPERSQQSIDDASRSMLARLLICARCNSMARIGLFFDCIICSAYQMKRIGKHPCSCLLRSFALGCRHLQT